MRQSDAFDDLGCHTIDPEISERIKRSLASRVDQVSTNFSDLPYVSIFPRMICTNYDIEKAFKILEEFAPRPEVHRDDYTKEQMVKCLSDLRDIGYSVPNDFEKLGINDLFYRHITTAIDRVNEDIQVHNFLSS